MSGQASRPFLDGIGARLLALAVMLGASASLAAIHWDDLFPEEAAERAADDPVALCYAERAADIDKMKSEGVIDDAQAASFKQRAEALCQAQLGGGAQPPTLPQN